MLLFLSFNVFLILILTFISKDKVRLSIKWVILVLGLIIISTYQQSKTPLFDTGAYHVVLATWISEYGWVKGIANLDPHYGLLSPVFIIAALLELVFKGHSWQMLNGLVFSAVLYFTVSKIAILKSNKNNIYWVLFPLVLFMNRFYIDTISPDLWQNLFTAFFIIKLVETIQSNEWTFFFELFLPLSVFMIWVKLSGIAILLFLLLLILIERKHIRFNQLWSSKNWVLLLISIPIAMMLSNFIISGYPLFPLTFIQFDVSWQVPEGRVHGLLRHIYLWGITPQYDLTKDYSDYSWIPEWWERNFKPGLFREELVLLILMPIQFVIQYVSTKQVKQTIYLTLLFCLQFVIWFNGSPNLRFLSNWIWMYASITLVFVISSLTQKLNSKSFDTFVTVGYLLFISWMLIHTARESGFRSKLLSGDWQAWIKPYNAPNPKFKLFTLENGNTVSIPLPSKQPWYIPLPSSRQEPVYAVGSTVDGFYPTEEAKQLKTAF